MAENKEKLRNALRDVHKQNINPYLIRDWSRDANLQYPCRNHIRQWVREEFLNRWRNFGLKYTDGSLGAFSDGQATNHNLHYGIKNASKAITAVTSGGDEDLLTEWDQNIYKGPKTAWARVVSNAIVTDPETGVTRNGFILGGNGNFHDTYGFDNGIGENGGGGEARTLLGFETPQNPNEDPKRHEIEEPDYKFRPSPGITTIESEDIEPGKNFRRTTVNFTCWSQAQLDYLEPYFFSPGYTVIVEWGWNTYPRNALLPLTERGYTWISKVWSNDGPPVADDTPPEDIPLSPAGEQIRLGEGNYGFAMGFISNFNYTMREDGGYDCTLQVSCMSEVGQQIQQEAGLIPQKDSSKYTSIKQFINTTLRRSLMGKNDVGANINDGLDPEDQKKLEVSQGGANSKILKAAEQEAVKIARGRYFTFNKYNSAKPFMAGKSNSNGGTYITVGYLVDIFNIFFNRVSTENRTRIVEFSCWGSRCVAHPNIKSVDGSVLLIPNSVAPRWNKETYHGSTVSRINEDGSTTNGAGYDILSKGQSGTGGSKYKETTQNFLEILRMMNPDISPGTPLKEALDKSPRDDLHKILTVKSTSGYNLQNPQIAGKIDLDLRNVMLSNSGKKIDALAEAWEEAEDAVRPFPDFHSDFFKTGNTMGYSGRIQDLYVSLDVITNSFETGDNASAILLDIMKKVSTAAGDMWQFAIIGADVNTSSNSVLQLVDTNYSGSESVTEQKQDAWVFPSHRGDSIVREMDFNVNPTSEMTAMIAFGNFDTKGAFYEKEQNDLVLRGVPKAPLEGMTQQVNNVDEKPKNIEDPDKYIVNASSSYFGIKNAANSKLPAYPTDTTTLYKGKGEKTAKKLGEHDLVYYKDNEKPYKDGPHVLRGKSEKQLRENIEKAKKDGNENSISCGSRTPYAEEFGPSSGFSNGEVSGPHGKQQYQVWIDSRGFNKLGAEQNSGREKWMDSHGVKKKIPTKYPSKLRRFLVGKAIYLGHNGWTHDHFDDYTSLFANPMVLYDRNIYPNDLPEKQYTVVKADLFNHAWTKKSTAHKDDGAYYYFYRLTIEDSKQEGLNESALREYHHAKKRHGSNFNKDIHLSDNLKKHINKQKLSTSRLDKIDMLKYKLPAGNPNSGSKNAKKISDETYGVKGDDYAIQIELVDIDRNRMVQFCQSDPHKRNNIINNMPIPGVDLSITLDGIEGLRLYDTFNCAGIPLKYYDRGIFGICGIKHSIGNGDWSTTIEAKFYPG